MKITANILRGAGFMLLAWLAIALTWEILLCMYVHRDLLAICVLSVIVAGLGFGLLHEAREQEVSEIDDVEIVTSR